MANEIKVDFQKTIENAFLQYSAHVLLERAIPDARDGLKLGARQGVYSQFKEGIVSGKPYKKAQKSVAAGMDLCYVHGDVSLYNTLIRMGKPFAFRYPLQDVQGNFGNLIRADNHAASRYVEMRLSPLSNYMFEGIKKNAIEKWVWNYDDTEQIPSVLPSPFFYNIVNGATGIGVGLATSIPTFNLRDVNKAMITLIKDPDAPFEKIYCPIDFPTGATVINEAQVKESLRDGKGKSAVVRATIEYDVKKHMLVVTEMPYMVYTETICTQLGELLEADPSIGIERVLDATTETTRIEIMLAKKANAPQMKEWLYANTSLQSYYGINMTMLDEGKVPKIFGWKEALVAHLTHTKQVKRREYEFDLNQAKARLHIVEGLLIAIEHIDAFIAIIKQSESTAEATKTMREAYGLSDEQAKAVLDIRLARLVSLEYVKVQKEKESLLATINDIADLLASPERFDAMLIDGFQDVINRFGDERRTINLNIAKEVEEKKVEVEPNDDIPVITYLSQDGVLYMVDAAKASKGKQFVPLTGKDFLIETVYGSRAKSLIILTNSAQAYTIDLNKLELNKSYNVYSLLELTSRDKIALAFHTDQIEHNPYIIIATKDGMVKKTKTKEYEGRKKGGLSGIKLKSGDSVVGVKLLGEVDEDILLATRNGSIIRFSSGEVGDTGRLTQGVFGIKLSAGDRVVDMVAVKPEKINDSLVSVTEQGYAKRTVLTEYPKTSRYGKGVINHKVKENDGVAKIALTSTLVDLVIGTATSSLVVPKEQVEETERASTGKSLLVFKNGSTLEYLGEVIK